MAKHRLTSRAPKFLTHAVLGAGVIASALGTHAAVSADTHTTTPVVSQAKPAAKPEEAKSKVSASQVLATARAQLGVKENAAGGGTKFQQWYASSPRAGETAARDGGARADYLNAAWCSMFVSWVGEHSGARSQIGWDAYTVSHAQWFKDNGRFGTQAKPGAVVFFSWKGGKDLSDIQHVGFVVKDNGDGTISTIEGNTGNGKVEERTRPTSQVVGYGYPSYAA